MNSNDTFRVVGLAKDESRHIMAEGLTQEGAQTILRLALKHGFFPRILVELETTHRNHDGQNHSPNESDGVPRDSMHDTRECDGQLE